MAEKKASRAEKAVTDAKKKTSTTASSANTSKKKESSAKKNTSVNKTTTKSKVEKEHSIPANAIVAIVSLALFILFVVISVNPDGALLKIIQSVLLGLIGQAGFYFAIPALLYMFVIHTFSRKTAVKMRSVCLILFVFCCGCIYHLIVQTQGVTAGFSLIPDLYVGGTNGNTGGVLCGSAAILLRWACGNVLAFIILIVIAILTLLGAMQITIPSIIRAIANRPRDDWEESEEEDYIEPAAIVVNHIANKQIEAKRQRRQRLEAPLLSRDEEEITQVSVPQQEKIRPSKSLQQVVSEPIKPLTGKGTAFMDRVDGMVNDPFLETAEEIQEDVSDIDTIPIVSEDRNYINQTDIASETVIPEKMPDLELQSVTKTESVIKSGSQKANRAEKSTVKKEAVSADDVAAEIAKSQLEQKTEYCFPPIDLLKRPLRGNTDGTDEMRENSRRLNETLASFNIDAHIINVTRGPSVTRYEVELDKGVRLNKLTGCADDIALSLGASGVRIAAVPGKISVVGIEVPNRTVTTVSLREVIDSAEFDKAKSKSSIALGKSIDGNCVVGNISKMPHLLIAGTTGSGKSVCMNSIIISLLYKAGPEDVKLIMVDPKMVELGIYNGIPHLLIPVVTDPKKAAGSLQWAVTEMLRRYKMMSDLGVRDLESYNSIVTAEEDGQKLPQVVIIIDELADLMMVAAKEVEDSICRIAQMGRAAGMHLIIATQRPSANVITGLMKANIPSRIAFSVASAMESRIILDTMGAEKLVGKGDMLYAPIGSGKPLRVQGCFVSDHEVEAVAGYVKENFMAEYSQDVLDEIEKKAQQTGKKTAQSDPTPNDEELEGDEMLPAAVDVILETGQASVSMLQRRLKLGYARAARIVDEMEEKGIVGPFQGSKPRSILITKEQWEARKNGNSQMEFDDLDDYGVSDELD